MTFSLKKPGFLDVEHTLDAGRSGEVRLPLKIDEAAKKAEAAARAKAKARKAKKARPPKAKAAKAKAPKPKAKKKSSRPGLF